MVVWSLGLGKGLEPHYWPSRLCPVEKSFPRRNQSLVRKWVDTGQSQNPQWKVGSTYFPSVGYKIYTLKFSDSKPLFPAAGGCLFVSSQGFTWQPSQNSTDCSNRRVNCDYRSIRQRRKPEMGLSLQKSPGLGMLMFLPTVMLLKSRWSIWPGPGLLILCLKLGLVWVRSVNQGVFLSLKKCTVHHPSFKALAKLMTWPELILCMYLSKRECFCSPNPSRSGCESGACVQRISCLRHTLCLDSSFLRMWEPLAWG